jgi:flagellar motor switch protein FliN/FliY
MGRMELIMSTNDQETKSNYDFNMILDIPLEVRVELGRSRMLVNDLLQLGQGSILELDKKVGDQVTIYVSEKLVARGEVVVMDEKFGIRLTDIVSPNERIKSLG